MIPLEHYLKQFASCHVNGFHHIIFFFYFFFFGGVGVKLSNCMLSIISDRQDHFSRRMEKKF
jgi:hypothetical protein